MASEGANPAHLPPSELGTKEYWNNLYTRELSNHASDPSDIGTVWFDDSDAEAKMIEYLSDQTESESNPLSLSDTSFLDLGCGNGSMLFALRDEGWTGPALGVDYSPQSVALAKQVAASKKEEQPDDDDTPQVSFAEWDVFAGAYDVVLQGEQVHGWDVVLDKGTFDAISLSSERDALGRSLFEGYRERVLPLVKQGGIFLLTSCNWTEEELVAWFVPGGNGGTGDHRFVVAGKVEYRSFSFGGAKGQTISTVCFRRV